MRKNRIAFFFTACLSLLFVPLAAKGSYGSGFISNQGQIRDQSGRERPDVLFGCEYKGLTMHIKTNGVSYQLSKTDGKRDRDLRGLSMKIKITDTWRIDEEWQNYNPNFRVEKGESEHTYLNYYLKGVCVQKLHPLKSLKLINLYHGIDVKYYMADDAIKYDFIVAPHADYRQIRIRLRGADIKLQSNGSLHLITPLGIVEEGAPVVFQRGRQVTARWVIHDNVLSFDIPGYDSDHELIIDPPARIWGTFYGGAGDELSFNCATDQSGNVYMAGTTESAGALIATTGAHQVSLGGMEDAFLAKFDVNGNRLWATYYGDTAYDGGTGLAVDQLNNVYLAGISNSFTSAVISTAAAHQTISGGGTDAFLVKFDAGGLRLWATWYGGAGDDYASGCTVDPQNNVYLTGTTSSSLSISTPGAQQASNKGNNDVFLVKFNSSGQRQWATYYGAEQIEAVDGCKSDAAGNIYVYGYVLSNTVMTTSLLVTPGCHQPVFGGVSDAFLAKYNSQGTLLWGTFYGGAQTDAARSCSPDNSGNVYLVGYTYSSNNISSGGFQNSTGGGEDAFICKFNSAGVRQWGTYYGGAGFDEAYGSCTDPSGNIVMVGFSSTPTSTLIASANAYQPNFNGVLDGLIVKFDPSGSRIWGTYYGDAGNDRFHSGAYDSQGRLYVTGTTTQASTVVVTPASHQTFFGGGFTDALLVRFDDCNDVNQAISVMKTACAGDTVMISSSNSGAVQWYSSSTSTAVIGTGVSFVTPALSAGTYTYFYQALTCSVTSASSVIIQVVPKPVISSNSGSICLGQNFTIQATGGNHYHFSPGASVFSPTATGNYTVWGVDINQCINSATANVIVRPLPNTSISSSNSVICRGEQAVLLALGNAVGYSWSNGAATNSIVVTPSVNTVYSLTTVNIYGCTLLSTYNQSVNPLPSVVIKSSDNFLCSGEQAVLTASGNATGFLWSNNATTPSITVSPGVSTVYSVTVTGANGCMFLVSYNQLVDACTGIAEQDEKLVSVFPGPFSEHLFIRCEKALHFEILSGIGQVVYTGELPGSEVKKIDLAELRQGIYYLRLQFQNRSEVHKIIKM